MRIYVATEESKKIIADAKRREANGESVDWMAVLDKSHELRAKTREQQIDAETVRRMKGK